MSVHYILQAANSKQTTAGFESGPPAFNDQPTMNSYKATGKKISMNKRKIHGVRYSLAFAKYVISVLKRGLQHDNSDHGDDICFGNCGLCRQRG